MNNILRIFVALSVSLLMVGCYKNTVSTGLPGGGEVHEFEAPFLLWGLAGDEIIDTNKLCPQGVSKIEEYMGPKQAGLYCITCGIYSPIQVDITCAGGQAWRIEASEETGLATVAVTTDQQSLIGGDE